MDSEGAEFEMLPMILKDGALDEHGVTVCLLNVEARTK